MRGKKEACHQKPPTRSLTRARNLRGTIYFRYGDLAGAASRHGGLAVLGVLFEMAEEDNPKFEPLVEGARMIEDRYRFG